MTKKQKKMPTKPSNQAIKVDDPRYVETSTMVPITAGSDRIKCILSSLRPHASTPSWRIVMDFDGSGDLTSYWEGSCDEDGNEVAGGGIERIEDGPSRGKWRAYHLSPQQQCINPADIEEYIASTVQGFVSDPPDTDSQWGYLSALLVVAKEAFGQQMDVPPFKKAHELWKDYELINASVGGQDAALELRGINSSVRS